MDKPEALRLAESAHLGYRIGWQRQAAAELRRLSAENKLLHERHHDDNVEYTRVLAQRDVLLQALKALVQNEGLEPYSYLDKGIGTATAAGQRWLNARAVVKAVEGEKNHG